MVILKLDWERRQIQRVDQTLSPVVDGTGEEVMRNLDPKQDWSIIGSYGRVIAQEIEDGEYDAEPIYIFADIQMDGGV